MRSTRASAGIGSAGGRAGSKRSPKSAGAREVGQASAGGASAKDQVRRTAPVSSYPSQLARSIFGYSSPLSRAVFGLAQSRACAMEKRPFGWGKHQRLVLTAPGAPFSRISPRNRFFLATRSSI